MTDKRWACLVLMCGAYLSSPGVSVAADLIVASSAKPLDMPVVPLKSQVDSGPRLPLVQWKPSTNPDATNQSAVKPAPQLPAAAPAVPTVPQEIAHEADTKPISAAPEPKASYELSPGPLKTAFKTIASRHNFRLHWEESPEWKPNSGFEYSLQMDGKTLFEDLKKFKEAVATSGRSVEIDIYEGNSVVFARGVN